MTVAPALLTRMSLVTLGQVQVQVHGPDWAGVEEVGPLVVVCVVPHKHMKNRWEACQMQN